MDINFDAILKSKTIWSAAGLLFLSLSGSDISLTIDGHQVNNLRELLEIFACALVVYGRGTAKRSFTGGEGVSKVEPYEPWGRPGA
jgi:hypothetical protein